MTTDDLSPMARAALLTLMAAGRPLSNTEMDEIAHFRLAKPEREKLNTRKLVESDTSTTPHVHVLTPLGREWCRRELTAEAPRRAGSPLVGALYVVLAGLNRHLHRSGVDLQDLFLADDQALDRTPTAERRDAETDIRSAYRKLVREPGGWVSLADLRAALDDLGRTEVNNALKRMIRQPDVAIIPEADQTALKQRDREAAVRIGGEDKHLISIGGP